LLSIITPHWNDINGLENLLTCFTKQTSANWEWIIVDDFSTEETQGKLKKFELENASYSIRIYFNQHKQNASVCRNQGANLANFNSLVFLDSDDAISPKFVFNRCVEVEEFIVFQNIVVKNGIEESPYSAIKSDYLSNFLQAKFAWQTTSILFNKEFFLNSGGFDNNLKLLQDVELSIRILLIGTNYKIITDNEIDFFYKVTPIDIQKRTLEKVSESVNYLICKLNRDFNLTKQQQKMLSAYYFLIIKYFVRSSMPDDIARMKQSLELFYKQNCIDFKSYFLGKSLLKNYSLKLINRNIFLKSNRYIFKK
jgi:glycosyltransferase involved in cell wall biosynthesis